jgi:hypothetical protein
MLVVAYIKDIIIATKGWIQKHRQHVGKVFNRILQNNIYIDIDNCHFDQKEVSFLGFIVSGKSVRMDPKKAQAVVDWPKPMNQEEVQQLLGVWNFYMGFIANYTDIDAPITDLLRWSAKYFMFREAHEAAFFKITILFTTGNTTIRRHFDQNRPTIIEMDVLDFSIGAVLSNTFEDGKTHPCDYLSR